MEFANMIMELLKQEATKDDAESKYINPHFLLALTESLETYYGLEDDMVDEWVHDMWGR